MLSDMEWQIQEYIVRAPERPGEVPPELRRAKTVVGEFTPEEARERVRRLRRALKRQLARVQINRAWRGRASRGPPQCTGDLEEPTVLLLSR